VVSRDPSWYPPVASLPIGEEQVQNLYAETSKKKKLPDSHRDKIMT
jgi:hypothetical protein